MGREGGERERGREREREQLFSIIELYLSSVYRIGFTENVVCSKVVALFSVDVCFCF